jgi:hypothetical protein
LRDSKYVLEAVWMWRYWEWMKDEKMDASWFECVWVEEGRKEIWFGRRQLGRNSSFGGRREQPCF